MISISSYKQRHKEKINVYLLTDKNQLSSFRELSPFAAIIKEKLDSDKTELTTFFEGNVRHVVLTIQRKEKDSSYRLEAIRAAGAKLTKLLNTQKAKSVYLAGSKKALTTAETYAFIEGMALSNYQFVKYKSKKNENTLAEIHVEEGALSQKEINELQNNLSAVKLSRDLVNEPVISLNAEGLSKAIRQQGEKCGFDVEVLNKQQIEALHMGGLLGVNRGSIDPPTFNILTYHPANAVNSKPIVFVGKGVVYDTGGYNLKTGGIMGTMKCDMAGASAVIGTLSAVSLNKLPVYAIGLIPATDNRIGLNALVQDDIITMHDGTTVEIQNTDAEGRLILADALSFAKKYKPELVIDLATLTGAASAITGPYGSALLGNDKKYKSVLIEKGEETYERLAELPFWKEYSELLKSDVADLKNIGGPTGGAITAAKFLEHFVDYNWLHIDIAGPAFISTEKDYRMKGGTGVGVRLLYHFTKEFIGMQGKKAETKGKK
jgi:leucyl aminopeptidase